MRSGAGSVPTAYLAGRLLKGVDLRTVGSGNLGATNVYRSLGAVPALAGRSPSQIVRQLYDFKAGTRNGANAAMMKPEVAHMNDDMRIDIAAYLASLNP